MFNKSLDSNQIQLSSDFNDNYYSLLKVIIKLDIKQKQINV